MGNIFSGQYNSGNRLQLKQDIKTKSDLPVYTEYEKDLPVYNETKNDTEIKDNETNKDNETENECIKFAETIKFYINRYNIIIPYKDIIKPEDEIYEILYEKILHENNNIKIENDKIYNDIKDMILDVEIIDKKSFIYHLVTNDFVLEYPINSQFHREYSDVFCDLINKKFDSKNRFKSKSRSIRIYTYFSLNYPDFKISYRLNCVKLNGHGYLEICKTKQN